MIRSRSLLIVCFFCFLTANVYAEGGTVLAKGTRTLLFYEIYEVFIGADVEKVKAYIANWESSSDKQLANNDEFIHGLSDSNMEWTLHMRLLRNLDTDDIYRFFRKAMLPRLAGVSEADREALLSDFESFFPSKVEVQSGDWISYTATEKGLLLESSLQQQDHLVSSTEFARAFFLIYLDQNAVIDGLFHQVISNARN